ALELQPAARQPATARATQARPFLTRSVDMLSPCRSDEEIIATRSRPAGGRAGKNPRRRSASRVPRAALLERQALLAPGDVPQARAPLAAGRQRVVVGAEGHGEDALAVALERRPALAVFHAPDLGRAVVAGGGEGLARAGEGHGGDPVVVALQRGLLL